MFAEFKIYFCDGHVVHFRSRNSRSFSRQLSFYCNRLFPRNLASEQVDHFFYRYLRRSDVMWHYVDLDLYSSLAGYSLPSLNYIDV